VGLVFNTGVSRGKAIKSARVMTNDTTQTNLSISFSVNIYASPDTVSTLRLSPDKLAIEKATKKQTVIVENHGQSRIELSLAETLHDNLRIKIKNDAIKPGDKGQIQFEWKGDFPKADLKHIVTFQTSDTLIKRFSVPCVIKGTEQPAPPAPPKITEQPKPQQPPPAPPKTTVQQTIARPVTSPVSTNNNGFGEQLKQAGQSPQETKADSTKPAAPNKGP
jgi:hypothetical protein